MIHIYCCISQDVSLFFKHKTQTLIKLLRIKLILCFGEPLIFNPIKTMLDKLRKELLNLTLRNNLIKLREFKARGLSIEGSLAEEVQDVMIDKESKAWFLSSEHKTPQHSTVLYLKTSYNKVELEKRLWTTYKEAKSFIEERGINALYLSVGTLKWYLNEQTEAILSPLVLVPVQLERTNSKGDWNFELKYIAEGVNPNYTLERKMEVDFGIKLPAFNEEESITEYINQVKAAVSAKTDWEVLPNDIRLNLFSFLKLMMYHDLDDTKWAEACAPSNSELLQNLLQDSKSLQNEQSLIEATSFDFDKLPISEISHILDADSSQAEAIESAFKHQHLVIQGPPGTGKSQTITNIIAACIKKNKTVLFVSEKLAALEVVKRKLSHCELDSACLELHSYKANRKEILNSIHKTLQEKESRTVRDNGELKKLEQSRKQLNTYYQALHAPIDNSERSAYQVIGEIAKIKQAFPDIKSLRVGAISVSKTTIAQFDYLVKSAAEFIITHGTPRQLPFWGSERVQIGIAESESLKHTIHELHDSLDEVLEKANRLSDKLQFPSVSTVNDLYLLFNTVNILLSQPDLNGINKAMHHKSIAEKDIKTLFELGKRFYELQEQYSDRLLAQAHHGNFHLVKQVYEEQGGKWYRFLLPSFRQAKKQLLGVLKTKPKSIAEQKELIDVLVQKADCIEQANALRHISHEIFSSELNWTFEGSSNWLQKEDGVNYIYHLKQQIDKKQVLAAALERLSASREDYELAYKEAAPLFSQFSAKLDTYLKDLAFEATYKDMFLHKLSLSEVKVRLNAMAQDFEALKTLCHWNSLKQPLLEVGHDVVIKALEEESVAPIELYQAWRYTTFIALLDIAHKTHPVLDDLNMSSCMETFQHSDYYLINQYNQLSIKQTHRHNIPSLQTVGEPMTVLRNEIHKVRRHLPLRKLFTQAGEMILRVKPVFMMSPLSIAQYLEPLGVKFDYVIFDEASQVKPIDAFGSLLRGRNSIVVGDDKQLPPSDYFNQIIDLDDLEDDEEGGSLVSDMQSILDLFVTKNAPQVMLTWHYRSQHDSLIAVSNKHFYDSKLINPPSAIRVSEELGLQFQHYPDTIYSAQKNEKEAFYIIEALKEHSRHHREQSIGIVTFSIRQKDCIENLLHKARREDPFFDQYLSELETGKEPFFIKNLENVQGDERDVIFISIGYGRNTEGKLSRNFGPINRVGGERRLNVLFTRAKLRCVLFSNFTANDLVVSEQDAKGLQVFKAFLDFAQNRILDAPIRTSKASDSLFEESVKAALEKEGYQVDAQVGHAGYYIDLAIPDTTQAGRYLLGIECDGAPYHSSKSARERDRLRQLVLESLGWRIYRIWSTDWYRAPKQELQKLLDYVALLKRQANDTTPSYKITRRPNVQPTLEDNTEAVSTWVKPYEQYTLASDTLTSELHREPDDNLIKMISLMLEKESPIHEDYIKSQITQAANISRIGNRLETKFNEVFNKGIARKAWTMKGAFLWSSFKSNTLEFVRDRSQLPTDKHRQLEWISPEEIQLAIKTITHTAIKITRHELMKETLRTLNGSNRISDHIRQILDIEINTLLDKKVLLIEQDALRVNY